MPCVSGTTPSTFGKSASASGVTCAGTSAMDALRWPSSSPRSARRCSCASPRGRRRARCHRTWPVGRRRRGRRTSAPGSSRSKLSKARLCVCTCWPGAMASVAVPMIWSYRLTGWPLATARTATLCPAGIASSARRRLPRRPGCPPPAGAPRSPRRRSGFRRRVGRRIRETVLRATPDLRPTRIAGARRGAGAAPVSRLARPHRFGCARAG
jgi:hypothetical protein